MANKESHISETYTDSHINLSHFDAFRQKNSCVLRNDQ